MRLIINGVSIIGPMSDGVQVVGKLSDFASNPGGELSAFLTNFFAECLETISIISYEWLLIAGLIALVMYVFGWEKGKNWGFMCPAIYMILQIVSKVLCSR